MNLLTHTAATNVRISLQSIGLKNAKQLRIFLDEPGHTATERRHARNCLDAIERKEIANLKHARK